MRIWVDADACPGAVRDIVVRAANRAKVCAVFVANKAIHLPVSPFLSTARVAQGADVADRRIADSAEAQDLAITADIPLAAALVAKGVVVIDPRGTLYTDENVGEALALRDFMHDLREGGLVAGGPGPFGPREAGRFAQTFDRQLSRLLALRPSPTP